MPTRSGDAGWTGVGLACRPRNQTFAGDDDAHLERLRHGLAQIAAAGRRLIERTGIGEGLLATVRGDAPPRIHPVNVQIVEGRLLLFVIVGSGKAGDLERDGRYALHAHQDPVEPYEFLVRGRAVEVTDAARRAAAAGDWPFEVGDGYRLYELSIDHAVFGDRASADAWPPVYTSWRAG